MPRHRSKSLVSFHGASPDGWKMPTGITWYMPPAWPTRAGSRQCSGNDAVFAALSWRSVSVLVATAAGRAARSQGSLSAARSLVSARGPSRAAAYSCPAGPPTSTASKKRPRVQVRCGSPLARSASTGR